MASGGDLPGPDRGPAVSEGETSPGAGGAREGTRPEDDPITRSISQQAEERGKAEGRREGRREAYAANVLAVLRARGIEVTPALAEDRELFDALPGDALIAAAIACRDEADFRRRLRNTAG